MCVVGAKESEAGGFDGERLTLKSLLVKLREALTLAVPLRSQVHSLSGYMEEAIAA